MVAARLNPRFCVHATHNSRMYMNSHSHCVIGYMTVQCRGIWESPRINIAVAAAATGELEGCSPLRHATPHMRIVQVTPTQGCVCTCSPTRPSWAARLRGTTCTLAEMKKSAAEIWDGSTSQVHPQLRSTGAWYMNIEPRTHTYIIGVTSPALYNAMNSPWCNVSPHPPR